MKLISTLSFLSAFVSTLHGNWSLRKRGPPISHAPSEKSIKTPEEHTINQFVDHFDPKDLTTWEMRYISNDQFFENGGPVFVFLGGEWAIDGDTLRAGQIFDMAEEHKGYMFYTEHRYYGARKPAQNFTVENLKYLSVEQALADVVYFVEYIKENIPGLEHSKVVVVGASYSACMAVWIRLKYPHVIDAAYASSGPVRAVADFPEYFDIVAEDIALVSGECSQTIQESMAQLKEKLKSPEGIQEMSQALQTCNPIQSDKQHQSFLLNEIAEIFAWQVQNRGLVGVEKFCGDLVAYSGSPLEKLVNFIKKTFQNECFPDYDDLIDCNKEGLCGAPWYYQTCTEFGYYPTTNNQLFDLLFDLDFYINMCSDIFGKDFGLEVVYAGVNRTNLFYGGSKPEVTKVVFVYGTVDPWHALGILTDLNPLAPAIVINGTTHCNDLGPAFPEDPPQLTAARERVKGLIREWIK